MPATTFHRASPLHLFDARVRLLLAFFLALFVVFLSKTAAFLPLLCFGLLFLFTARPIWKTLCKRILAVNCFLAFLWLFTPWTTPGTALYLLGPLTITREGIELAWMVTLKANTIALFFTLFVASQSTTTLAHALNGLSFPASFTFMLLFSEHAFHILAREWQKLQEAAKLRAFTARCSIHSYKTIAQLLAILILRSFDQAQRSYDALRLRGFTGVFIGTLPGKPTRNDVYLIVVFLLSLGLAFWLEAL